MMGRSRYLQMKSSLGNFLPSHWIEIKNNIDFLLNYALRVPLILTLKLDENLI